jgi:hypothetical protein
MLIQGYQALGQPKELLASAKDLLAANAAHLQALYWIVTLVPGLELKEAADLDLGEKAGQALLAAAVPDLHPLAHNALGYIAMVRGDNSRGETHFHKSLELKPGQAQVSSWLGVVIYRQKKTERTSEVLYHYARAAALGLPDAQANKRVEDYLAGAYAAFHGEDPQGLAELKAAAAKAPFPPAGYRIENINEIAIRKEAEFRNANPQLALWAEMKKELSAPAGGHYFETRLKRIAVPKLKGTIVSGNSRELLIGIEKPNVAEVTLKLDGPLKGRPAAGTEIEWEGVGAAFSREPFMLTFEVARTNLSGLRTEVNAEKRK